MNFELLNFESGIFKSPNLDSENFVSVNFASPNFESLNFESLNFESLNFDSIPSWYFEVSGLISGVIIGLAGLIVGGETSNDLGLVIEESRLVPKIKKIKKLF